MILVGTLCENIQLTKGILRNTLFANETKKWFQYVWEFTAKEFKKVFEKEHRYPGIINDIIKRLEILFKTASIIRYFGWKKYETRVSHFIILPAGIIKKDGGNENVVPQ